MSGNEILVSRLKQLETDIITLSDAFGVKHYRANGKIVDISSILFDLNKTIADIEMGTIGFDEIEERERRRRITEYEKSLTGKKGYL